jgi:superfamily I DNA/RNA helicase
MNYVQALIKQKGKEPWKEVMNKWGKIDYDNLNMYLNSNSINYKCLGSNYGQISNMGHNINIMTYHGSMGFEFDNVFLPYVNSGLYISTNDDISKNVFVLAMTRARHRLYITYSGSLHPYIVLIKDRCRRIRINNETENDNIFTL